MRNDFLVVHKKICGENYEAVIEARRLITINKINISDACDKLGISRGTYYKYKDYVFEPSSELGKRAILNFILKNEKGVLSNLLNYIANEEGNILAINQEMPINNVAYVNISIDVLDMKKSMDDFLINLNYLDGIINAQLVAIE